MIVIKAEHPHSDVASKLIDGLNRAIWERYPDMRRDNSDEYKANNLLSADTPFFVAWLDGEPVGCGAYRPMDERTIEVKRMYVAESARRLGIGRAILAAVEDAGREAGFSVARLETGTAQTEAIALYGKDGYVRIPCWPPYDALPASICMEKVLGGSGSPEGTKVEGAKAQSLEK